MIIYIQSYPIMVIPSERRASGKNNGEEESVKIALMRIGEEILANNPHPISRSQAPLVILG